MNTPLPHQVTQAATQWDNPMGTDGFEFIEYAAPDPKAMGALFERMGFKPVARPRHKDVTPSPHGRPHLPPLITP